MLLAFDAHYTDERTRLVAAGFRDWADPEPDSLHVWETGPAVAYEPGQFYKRELPIILDALRDFDLDAVQAVIVDGYVYLDGEGRLGLGGYLYEKLGGKVPVVGVAKSFFRGNTAVPVLRGESSKPLYVTALGMDPEVAAAHLRSMAGPYRMPNILAAVDRGTKA